MTTGNRELQIQSKLTGLRQKVRWRFFLHGSGWMISAVAGLLLLHFTLDRLLVLPSAVRLVFLLALLYYLISGFRRRILYPLGRSLGSSDMALLLERSHPSLQHELISAVQLSRRLHANALGGESRAMVERTIAQAASDLDRLSADRTLDPRRTLRIWSLAAGLGSGIMLSVLLAPDSFAAWCTRLFGFDTPYPRETFLAIHVPVGQGNYKLRDPGGEGEPLLVDLARGEDLPVNVGVRGTVPHIVELLVEPFDRGTAMSMLMNKRGERRFRYLCRRVLRPVRISARGGDDPGTREIHVRILTPPVVTDLSVAVTPPAYTGLEQSQHPGGLVEALPGSRVALTLSVNQRLREGSILLQESGQELPLELLPAPGLSRDDGSVGTVPPPLGEDPGAEARQLPEHTTRYRVRLVMPSRADRYRIRLLAENGLRELSAGLHSLVPVQDRKPRTRVFTPGPSLQAMTPSAAIPLRLLASDDYGLTRISIQSQLGEKGKVRATTLWTAAKPEVAVPAGPSGKVLKKSVLRFLNARELLPVREREPREGDRLRFLVHAVDNRDPDPQQGSVQTIRIHLHDKDELRRRLRDRLRSTRRVVETARKVQAEQSARLDSFLIELKEARYDSSMKLSFAALESGQSRVRSSLRRVRGDLTEVLDAHLFNGLDSSPGVADVLALYRSYYTEHPEASATDPGFYLAVSAARRTGRVASLDLLARLIEMFGISHVLYEDRTPACLGSLAEASTADNDEELEGNLEKVQHLQRDIVEGLDQLLHLLEDWNNYQDLVRNARRLKAKQEELMDRSRGGDPKRRR